jgi:hypothetical protein
VRFNFKLRTLKEQLTTFRLHVISNQIQITN